ncbi:MAG: hydroxymethylbilane synthase [Rhizobiaceae bacterium]|nr:hydroxymethylbilane synthase [Rhizobiaceae bacterium]
MTDKTIRIGTRGSQLALVQAEYMKSLLQATHAGLEVDIEVISTAGDRSQKSNIALSEIGGKGLFTMEIEEKLSNGEIDMAVHSAKDMPTALPEDLALVCFPPRENVADAFISHKAATFDQLEQGAIMGSASLRRRALMWRKRPDLEMVMYRGNVGTRLQKLKDGVADATLLACAGLNRLGMSDEITSELPIEDFPPAPGQGAITIEAHRGNSRMLELLQPLNHRDTHIALTCERAFLEELDGSCRTPIGAHAVVDGEKLSLHGIILKPDGTEDHEARMDGTVTDARQLGLEMGKRLKLEAGEPFFEGWS